MGDKYVEINPLAINFQVFRILINLETADIKERKDFDDYIKKIRNVNWFFDMQPNWEKDIIMVVKDNREFNEILSKIKLQFNKIIRDIKISQMIQLYHFDKDYLIDKKRDYKPKEWNQINYPVDKEILKILIDNPHEPDIHLAKKLNISVLTLIKRIKKYKQNNIIIGFRTHVNAKLSGYNYYRLHINLKDYDSNILENLKNNLYSNPHLIYHVIYINGDDLEFEIHCSNDQINELKEEVLQNYGKFIKDITIYEFIKEHVFKYFPNIL